jgi:hypothetical protein
VNSLWSTWRSDGGEKPREQRASEITVGPVEVFSGGVTSAGLNVEA